MRATKNGPYLRSFAERRRDYKQEQDALSRKVLPAVSNHASLFDIGSRIAELIMRGEYEGGLMRRILTAQERRALARPAIIKANKLKKAKRARCGRRRK